jgi:hypothetical protein
MCWLKPCRLKTNKKKIHPRNRQLRPDTRVGHPRLNMADQAPVDFTQPVAVFLVAVMHFLPTPDKPSPPSPSAAPVEERDVSRPDPAS